jgi:hypothetical protein
MVNDVLSFVTILSWDFWACTEAVMCLIFDWVFTPSIDPYIPCAKRPPSYLMPFLDWLNSSIDAIADSVAPCITVNSLRKRFIPSTTIGPSSGSSHWPDNGTLQFLAISLPQLPQVFSTGFFWWRFRIRHQNSRVYAMSALCSGLARAYSATSPPGSRAIFDSDSYNILVDGGATACISNSLSDFLMPPTTS